MQEPKIIYEDAVFFVIEKPSGMTVNKADTTKNEITLQDWIETKFKIQSSKFKIEEKKENGEYNPAWEFHNRGGIVHRLDKETSGIILVAKNGESFIGLQLQFNRKRFGVIAGGREALTEYTVIKNYELRIKNHEEKLSLVELYPKTGRTHQIRVHVKYINHPVFSDPLYAGRKVGRDDRKLLPRLFLHAATITFVHPATQKEMHFENSLPAE